MAKNKTYYVCTECGSQSPRWQGRCLNCGQWNTFIEQQEQTGKIADRSIKPAELTPLSQISEASIQRITTDFTEVDRVLGGGMVPGSVILLGGEPGSGKSTVLLQYADAVAANGTVLYLSGEESKEQVSLRAKRLDLKHSDKLLIADVQFVEELLQFVESSATKPILVVVDSIQTVRNADVESKVGSLVQVQAVVHQLVEFAKQNTIACVLVGHVTKEGNLAGPKTVEHLVDVVLYLEGDSDRKTLLSGKNRFGSVNELAFFDFSEGRFEPTAPSFLTTEPGKRTDHVGAVVTIAKEGGRYIPLEIQALVVRSYYQQPRRVVNGYDFNRLLLLIAILDKFTNSRLYQYDVFINVAEGVRIHETAADLAICLAIVSSLRKAPVPANSAVWGEVSLLGTITGVAHHNQRVKEAEQRGMKQLITANEYAKVTDALRVLVKK